MVEKVKMSDNCKDKKYKYEQWLVKKAKIQKYNKRGTYVQ